MAEVKVSRSKGRQIVQEEEPLNIQLDLSTLNVMCRFVISDSTYVRRYDLSQMRKFIKLITKSMMETYDNDIRDRLTFIRLGLAARLDHRLTNRDAIFGYISSNFSKDIDFVSKDDLIGREDINWINHVVSETLKYAFVYRDIPEWRNLFNEFSQTTAGHRGDIVERIEAMNNRMRNQFRDVAVQDENNTLFSLQGELFENQVTDTYNAVRSPSSRLMTGMVGFNLMTGGLENGRVYMLIGDSGIGKSFTLLNLILQIKKYNPQYKTKDPTKTPCIVLLTMENTMRETITRLFSLVNESDRPMAAYNNLNDIFEIMRKQGGLIVNDQSPIDIVVKYKPNHSVDTDYLYDLYDELGDNGLEPILLVQDHVKRIRSVETEKEFRIELGNIVNEFKAFAADKDIPVLTDSHVNRAASITIDKGANKGIGDITRRVGKGDTGESMMMIENLDMAIVINKEMDNTKQWYMVFSAVKMRDNMELNYFAQPLMSKIKLVEDVGLPRPVYKVTLVAQGDLYNQAVNNGSRVTPGAMIVSDGYDDFEEAEVYNIETQEIGVPDIEEIEANLITYENETMWERAKRLHKHCPVITYTDEATNNSILDGINNIIGGTS